MSANSAPKSSKLAITALVLACLIIVPFLPILGGILGIVALLRISGSRGQLGGQGLAIAAIIVGFVVGVFMQGVLAAIAIPNFIRFQQRSKATEAKVSLRSLGAMAVAKAEAGGLPLVSTDWVPAAPCCQSANKVCAVSEGDWSAAPWSDLGFRPSERFRYQYRYSATAEGALVLEARGDLDCDGTYSSYRLQGSKSAAGGLELGELQTTDELE